MPGGMQKPMQPQYGQNMQTQYGQNMQPQNMQPGGQAMRPTSPVMPPDVQQLPRPFSPVMPPNSQQPGAQPMRPNAPLNSQFRMMVEPNRLGSAVMPMQGLKQAMMQKMMRRK